MFRKLFCVFILIVSQTAYAQSETTTRLPLIHQPTTFGATFENIKIQGNNHRMGLVGLHYLVDFKPWFYAGIGGYGAVSGNEGGLFNIGLNAGFRYQIKRLVFLAGGYVGAGGKNPALVGGGLMLRPYGDILWDFGPVRIGGGYSYVKFPSGNIDHAQWNAIVNFPTGIDYLDPTLMSNGMHNLIYKFKKEMTSHANYLGFFAQAYFQKKGTKNTSNKTQDRTMGLAGFSLQHYLDRSWLLQLKMSGALHGVPHGYMDVFTGAGYTYYFSKQFMGLAIMNLGAGGGGSVETGGGFLVNPTLGLRWQMTQHFATVINGGYIYAPDGQLQGFTAGLNLQYAFNLMSLSDKPQNVTTYEHYGINHWRFRILNQIMFSPQRQTGSNASGNINLFAMQPDYLINSYWYITGQGAFANGGEQAGSLASGLIGTGVQTPVKYHLQLFGELLVGAAGGGQLALEHGSVVEPNVGINIILNHYISLQAAVSHMKSLRSKLSTTMLNTGLVIHFMTLNGE